MTLDALLRDISFTLRQLRRSPGFAFTTVLTLTLAITVNLIVFGVVNALLLHPLPIAEPRQVFQVQGREASDLTISYPNYRDLRDRNHSFSSVALSRIARIGLGVAGDTQPVWGYEASGNYFSTLGVRPFLGRFFLPSEDTNVNGSPVVILSFSSWQVRFHADPQIIGKTVLVNKHPYTIIGVAPRNFSGTERFLWPELWVPYQNQPEIEGYSSLERRGDSNAWVIARLAPNVTAEQANADLDRIAHTLAHDFPRQDQSVTLRLSRPGLGGDGLGGPVRAFLGGVMLLALLVLIAACANLGGLVAARTADRSRELGIRIAIGSSRAAILRQLLLEALTISMFGGVAASFFAALLLRGVTHWHPASVEVPIQFQVEPDATVYLAAALLALLTGLFFGILPARQVWRTDPNHTLRASSSTNEGSRFTVRSVLLVIQVALCALLITSSFVALRGLTRTFSMPLGITPEGVSVATLDLGLVGYDGHTAVVTQEALADAVARTPGITAVAYANSTPLSANRSSTAIFAPGTTNFGAANARFNAQCFSVSPTYFSVAGTHLLRGRAFTPHDDAHAPLVVIVNQTFALRLFNSVDAVGQHFPDGNGHQYEVVGVVEDGKYATLSEDPSPAMFWPILQSTDTSTVLLARSQLSSEQTLAALRTAISGVDPGIPVFTLNAWSDALGLATFPARIATIALGVLGALAIMLALTGTFALANYTVSRRMREFGIRVALGAHAQQILRAALERTAWLLGIGSVIGLGLGLAAGKLLASIVYHATAADPLILAGVILTMACLGLLAAALPARRALRAEPAQLLREQ